eukprot:15246164-Alexandrium_andersonii.AAC.1
MIFEFFHTFARVAGGPDVGLASWIRSIAPLAAKCPIASRGVSPAVDEEARATQQDIDDAAVDP